METLKLLLKEPVIIALGLEIIVLIIGKLDKSNKIAKLIIKLGKALESKNK